MGCIVPIGSVAPASQSYPFSFGDLSASLPALDMPEAAVA
jgi:hypothetical protein